jgi:hypothetical protein
MGKKRSLKKREKLEYLDINESKILKALMVIIHQHMHKLVV